MSAARPSVRRVRPALLPLAGVAELLGIGLSTAERLKAAGQIGPRPVRLAGPKWAVAELKSWIAHPGPDGQLLDAVNWPPVWAEFRRRATSRR